VDEEDKNREESRGLAARNRRLAIILGLISAAFYAAFVLYYWK
jgi:hypothetical protein